jgi:hypothetical protein
MLNHRRCNGCDPSDFARLMLGDNRGWPDRKLTKSQLGDLRLEADIQLQRVDKAFFDKELEKSKPKKMMRDFVTYQSTEK